MAKTLDKLSVLVHSVSARSGYGSDGSDDYGELQEDDEWLMEEEASDGDPAPLPADMWGPQQSQYLRDNRAIYRIMNQIQVFSTLDDSQKEQIIRELETETFRDGEEIVVEGTMVDPRGDGMRLYIIWP